MNTAVGLVNLQFEHVQEEFPKICKTKKIILAYTHSTRGQTLWTYQQPLVDCCFFFTFSEGVQKGKKHEKI